MPRRPNFNLKRMGGHNRPGRPRLPGQRRPVRIQGERFNCITAALLAYKRQIRDPGLLGKTQEQKIKKVSERMRSGWSAAQALGLRMPPRQAKLANSKPIACFGQSYASIRDLALRFGIKYKILCQRLAREGWTPEAAVGIFPPPEPRDRFFNTKGLIYACVHKPSGKTYIGLSIDQERRLWQHLALSKGGTTREDSLQHAIAVHGFHEFEIKVLEKDISAVLLGIRERYWIKTLNTITPSGFNLNAGGVLGSIGNPVVIDGQTYFGWSQVSRIFNEPLGKLQTRIRLGWSPEEAVGLKMRASKTRHIVRINVGQPGPSEFPSAKAACRYFKLGHGELSRKRAKTGESWQSLIYAELTQFHQRNDAEAPQFIVQYPRAV
jgi:hypothetical protein